MRERENVKARKNESHVRNINVMSYKNGNYANYTRKYWKVQVGKIRKRRNQKKTPTPKTKVGKNKLTIRYLYHENIS